MLRRRGLHLNFFFPLTLFSKRTTCSQEVDNIVRGQLDYPIFSKTILFINYEKALPSTLRDSCHPMKYLRWMLDQWPTRTRNKLELVIYEETELASTVLRRRIEGNLRRRSCIATITMKINTLFVGPRVILKATLGCELVPVPLLTWLYRARNSLVMFVDLYSSSKESSSTANIFIETE